MVRVYILSHNDLFGQGVTNLLRCESDIEIVGQGDDIEQANAEVQRLTPDAVIVESDDLLPDSAWIVTHLLKTDLPVKVICMNLEENKLQLYCGEQREARGVEDLVEAIKTELSPSHPKV